MKDHPQIQLGKHFREEKLDCFSQQKRGCLLRRAVEPEIMNPVYFIWIICI